MEENPYASCLAFGTSGSNTYTLQRDLSVTVYDNVSHRAYSIKSPGLQNLTAVLSAHIHSSANAIIVLIFSREDCATESLTIHIVDSCVFLNVVVSSHRDRVLGSTAAAVFNHEVGEHEGVFSFIVDTPALDIYLDHDVSCNDIDGLHDILLCYTYFFSLDYIESFNPTTIPLVSLHRRVLLGADPTYDYSIAISDSFIYAEGKQKDQLFIWPLRDACDIPATPFVTSHSVPVSSRLFMQGGIPLLYAERTILALRQSRPIVPGSQVQNRLKFIDLLTYSLHLPILAVSFSDYGCFILDAKYTLTCILPRGNRAAPDIFDDPSTNVYTQNLQLKRFSLPLFRYQFQEHPLSRIEFRILVYEDASMRNLVLRVCYSVQEAQMYSLSVTKDQKRNLVEHEYSIIIRKLNSISSLPLQPPGERDSRVRIIRAVANLKAEHRRKLLVDFSLLKPRTSSYATMLSEFVVRAHEILRLPAVALSMDTLLILRNAVLLFRLTQAIALAFSRFLVRSTAVNNLLLLAYHDMTALCEALRLREYLLSFFKGYYSKCTPLFDTPPDINITLVALSRAIYTSDISLLLSILHTYFGVDMQGFLFDGQPSYRLLRLLEEYCRETSDFALLAAGTLDLLSAQDEARTTDSSESEPASGTVCEPHYMLVFSTLLDFVSTVAVTQNGALSDGDFDTASRLDAAHDALDAEHFEGLKNAFAEYACDVFYPEASLIYHSLGVPYFYNYSRRQQQHWRRQIFKHNSLSDVLQPSDFFRRSTRLPCLCSSPGIRCSIDEKTTNHIKSTETAVRFITDFSTLPHASVFKIQRSFTQPYGGGIGALSNPVCNMQKHSISQIDRLMLSHSTILSSDKTRCFYFIDDMVALLQTYSPGGDTDASRAEKYTHRKTHSTDDRRMYSYDALPQAKQRPTNTTVTPLAQDSSRRGSRSGQQISSTQNASNVIQQNLFLRFNHHLSLRDFLKYYISSFSLLKIVLIDLYVKIIDILNTWPSIATSIFNTFSLDSIRVIFNYTPSQECVTTEYSLVVPVDYSTLRKDSLEKSAFAVSTLFPLDLSERLSSSNPVLFEVASLTPIPHKPISSVCPIIAEMKDSLYSVHVELPFCDYCVENTMTYPFSTLCSSSQYPPVMSLLLKMQADYYSVLMLAGLMADCFLTDAGLTSSFSAIDPLLSSDFHRFLNEITSSRVHDGVEDFRMQSRSSISSHFSTRDGGLSEPDIEIFQSHLTTNMFVLGHIFASLNPWLYSEEHAPSFLAAEGQAFYTHLRTMSRFVKRSLVTNGSLELYCITCSLIGFVQHTLRDLEQIYNIEAHFPVIAEVHHRTVFSHAERFFLRQKLVLRPKDFDGDRFLCPEFFHSTEHILINKFLRERVLQSLPFLLLFYRDSPELDASALLAQERPRYMLEHVWVSAANAAGTPGAGGLSVSTSSLVAFALDSVGSYSDASLGVFGGAGSTGSVNAAHMQDSSGGAGHAGGSAMHLTASLNHEFHILANNLYRLSSDSSLHRQREVLERQYRSDPAYQDALAVSPDHPIVRLKDAFLELRLKKKLKAECVLTKDSVLLGMLNACVKATPVSHVVYVSFEEDPGIDAGGIFRSALTMAFDDLFKEAIIQTEPLMSTIEISGSPMLVPKYSGFIPQTSADVYPRLSEKRSALYYLGRLFGFAAIYDVKIMDVLDDRYWQSLVGGRLYFDDDVREKFADALRADPMFEVNGTLLDLDMSLSDSEYYTKYGCLDVLFNYALKILCNEYALPCTHERVRGAPEGQGTITTELILRHMRSEAARSINKRSSSKADLSPIKFHRCGRLLQYFKQRCDSLGLSAENKELPSMMDTLAVPDRARRALHLRDTRDYILTWIEYSIYAIKSGQAFKKHFSEFRNGFRQPFGSLMTSRSDGDMQEICRRIDKALSDITYEDLKRLLVAKTIVGRSDLSAALSVKSALTPEERRSSEDSRFQDPAFQEANRTMKLLIDTVMDPHLLSEEDLTRFVFAATGSKYLAGIKLQISTHADGPCAIFHTCNYTIEVPAGITTTTQMASTLSFSVSESLLGGFGRV